MDSNSGDGVDDNSLGDSFMILNEACLCFDFSMDSNSGDGVDDNSLGDSFMAGGPYMVDSMYILFI